MIDHRDAATFSIGGDMAVARLGFGAMRLPRDGFRGPARSPEDGIAVLQRAIELGVDHIDTADFYRSGDGSVRSNDLIRTALHPYPEDLVIATKVGPIFETGGPREASRQELRPAIESNLTSLGLDRLDLVYLRVGIARPPHESIADRFEEVAQLQAEGLIRHLGISNISVEHLREAHRIAPVTAVQNAFSLRAGDRSVLDECLRSGIAFVPFGSLSTYPGVTDEQAEADRTAALERVAVRHGATPAQVAIAWTLALGSSTLAIPGTGSVVHLEENQRARDLELSKEDLYDLEDTR